MPLAPGQRLSHYRLLEKIGEGGMGVVWKARDDQLRREVALKVLPSQWVQNPERRRRLLHEARSAAAVNHSNIATVYSVDESDGEVFIAMELVQGKALRSLMVGGPLPTSEAIPIMRRIATGLASAHNAGVVHRDLKPENVMVGPEGEVKILDFGLARLLERHAEVSPSGLSQAETATQQITGEGRILGTPAYMSPEQARGGAVDARSDVFSFGSVLYEVVTGTGPFRCGTPVETLGAILNRPAVPPSQLNAEIPLELERILGKCLEKNPRNRYQDAKDLVVDLRKLEGVSGADVPALQRTPSRRLQRLFPLVALAALAVLAVALAYFGRDPAHDAGATAPARKMIVVLPFENLGPPEDEYFVAGMTDEITSRLAMVSGLGVISRASASQYDKTGKTMKQVGGDFGVQYVLDGTVRWARSTGGAPRVRITPQLVHVVDDRPVWTKPYERVVNEVFEVQVEIAQAVIEHLQVALLESERTAVEASPTEVPEAYQAYLRGQYYEGRAVITAESYELAIQMFQRAIELDHGFALAYAGLARTHGGMYLHRWDHTEKRRSLAKDAIDKAVELAPNSPEIRLELGYYYYRVEGEFGRALEQYALVEKALPNHAKLLEYQGAALRRQGHFEEGLEHFLRAAKLNPRYARIAADAGDAARWLRRYELAIEYYDRAIALAPDESSPYMKKIRTLWNYNGSTAEAQNVLDSAPGVDDRIAFWQEAYTGKYLQALDRASTGFGDGWARDTYSAFAHDMLGQELLARQFYDSARIELEQVVAEQPKNFVLLSMLGIMYAGLDRKEDAIRTGKASMEMHPLAKDAVTGTFPMVDLARIYAMVGEYEEALNVIEQLLAIPADLSVSVLQIDPLWGKPLWDHPRFQELVDRYG